MTRRLTLCTGLVVTLAACGPNGGAADEAGAEGESGGVATDGAATGMATDGMGTAGGSADETGDTSTEPLPPPPSTGLEIVEVTVDQGIRIPVARDSALVGPTERNSAVLQNRPAVVRAFYETDPGYVTRSIYAVLTIEHPDGTTVPYESFVNTSAEDCSAFPYIYECRYSSPSGSFIWRIEPEDMVPGVVYSIEMFETSPGHEDDVSDKSSIFPADGGAMQIGIENSYMKMRVVVVPFDHDIDPECAEAPDLLAEFGTDYHGNPRTVADYFAERLLAQNPADEVEIIVHDVVPYFGNAQQGFGILDTLQQMRFQEGAPPEYYYYGVIRPCGGGPEFSGIAQLGGPSQGQAAQRVGWGVYHGSVSTTAETFVHEIGHEQGRFHIACSGEEGGPDPSYPDHPEGDTEGFGIDVISNPVSINPPSSHDYMTYCGTTWVSEWAWHLVSPWIAEISSWEQQASRAPTRPLLVGTVRADGTSSFYLTEGWFDEDSAREGHTVRFFEDGALLSETAAQWVHWERSEDYNVIVPLPVEDATRIDTLSWHTPQAEGDIDRASLRWVRPTSLVE